MNIRVDLNTPIKDGTEVVFRSPVDCSQITGLIVYYPENGNTVSTEFAFADAHGNNVGDIDHLFAENVVVKVILDVTTGMAFVQNADTNAYLESRFAEMARKTSHGIIVEGITGGVEIDAGFEEDETGRTHSILSFLGDNDGTVRLTRVADGVDDWDAATVGQVQRMIDGSGGGSASTPDHSMYFDIDVDGLVSLKPEYRGLGESTTVKDENDNTIYDDYGNPVYRYPYSHSDNGLGIVGSKYVELPENLVIPDVINDIAVATFVNGIFDENHRIKSLTIPAGVTSLPEKFASKTINLAELYGTENIEVIYGAAFQYSAIKKAIFPKLKELNATGYQFNQCANLSVVDIGNTVTKIARNCFAHCDRLSLVRGGASVTGIEAKAFFGTRSLKNLPLVEKVKTIQTEAFVLSRVSNIGSGYSDWWAFYDAKVCSFNTNAIPAIFNKSKWWEIEGYTPTACKNSLGSTFDQINPEWAELQLPTDSGVCKDKWGDACVEISTIHIYSALTGRKFNTPMEFMELLRGKTDDQGSLLTPVKAAEGNPDYSWSDMARWFAALSDDDVSFETEQLVHNAESFKKICAALAEGALVLTHINPRHAAVIYGVAENGEMLLLDSNGRNGYLGDHTARTYQQPIWSFALKNNNVLIVKKKEE